MAYTWIMLAERARTPLLAAAVATLATLSIAALAPCPSKPAAPATFVISAAPPATGTAIEIADFCPSHVRAAIHLGEDATLYCVRGLYPEPGTFVFARYRTTESWDRFAVVADDGHLIVPMLDRPSTHR